MECAISTKELTCRFGTAVAVDGLTISVPTAGITAFLGPNGAGKTTTIRTLLGLLKAHRGSCEILGFPPGHPCSLSRLGALVESPSLYDHLTGRENIEITRLMKNASRSETDRVLSLVGLRQDAHRPVRAFSLGMRQRLGVAMALVGNPALLILDEPNNGLDPIGILQMRELFRRAAAEYGTTIFLSSHILAEVELLASTVIVLDKGRLRYQGAMENMGLPSEGILRLVVGEVDTAIAHLSSRRIPVDPVQGAIHLKISPQEIPAMIASLVEAGVQIYEATPIRCTLESRFLSLLETP